MRATYYMPLHVNTFHTNRGLFVWEVWMAVFMALHVTARFHVHAGYAELQQGESENDYCKSIVTRHRALIIMQECAAAAQAMMIFQL